MESLSHRKEQHPIIGQTVSMDDVITLDGYKRDVIVINDQMPGPVINVMEGVQVRGRPLK